MPVLKRMHFDDVHLTQADFARGCFDVIRYEKGNYRAKLLLCMVVHNFIALQFPLYTVEDRIQ